MALGIGRAHLYTASKDVSGSVEATRGACAAFDEGTWIIHPDAS